MNVLSLFDGISCGQVALNRMDVTYDNYYASEIDKHAIQITQHNYPNTIQLGDVTNIKGDDLPKIDLLIGGSPCFVKGTSVLTYDGYKNIEDVVVGDYVYTHLSRYKKVLKIGGKKNQPVYSIKAQGMVHTLVTKDHPYYVKEMVRKYDKTTKKMVRVFSDCKWKTIGEMGSGDYVGIKINEIEENPLNITKEEAFIIGRYIADGHTRKDYRKSENRENHRMYSLILSIGNSKLDYIKTKINDIKFTEYPHTKSTYRVCFYNKRLVEIVENQCGCGSGNKYISPTLMNLPKDLLLELLNGYLSGDGHVYNKTFKATTISKHLALSISMVVAKCFNVNTNVVYQKKEPTTIIEGRLVNQKSYYVLSFIKTPSKSLNTHISEGFIWYPVKEIKLEDVKCDVYNLEVDEDNTYTANNFIVHNCQSFSNAGNGSGFEGKSGIFWEYVRLLEELKPSYFLLENVKMKKEWIKIITEAIGVEPIKINSNLLSAQNRERLYWTNIPNITQPENKNIFIEDILDDEFDKKYWLKPRNSELLRNKVDLTNAPNVCCIDVYNKKFKVDRKSPTLTLPHHNSLRLYQNGRIRKLTPEECEKLQTLPVGYTNAGVSDIHRYSSIGNGWTVDVIAHIFGGLR